MSVPPGTSHEGSAPLEGGQSHTPGPWGYWPHYGGYEGNFVIGPGNFETVAEARHGSEDLKGDVEANARLIAAAPDLLAACKALIDAATTAPPIELVKRLDACVVIAATAYAKATQP